MSQWTSKRAIVRDLSMAQGNVPVGLEGTLKAGEKPPSLNIAEETEEEFFDQCSGDGAVVSQPDYKLIKRMLDMVREGDSEEEDNNKIFISKMNPDSSEFIPNVTQTPKKPIKKRLKNRNIALESILEAIEIQKNYEQNVKMEMKLLKPDDFMLEVSESKIEATEMISEDSISKDVVVKVNGWLDKQKNPELPKKKSPKLNLEATNMFKRKSVVAEKVKPVKRLEESVESPQKNGVFQPSQLANEYYQKFLERNRLRDAVKESIWSKAEKKMKEIDERKKLEAACAVNLPSSSTSIEDSENDNNDEQSDPDITNVKSLKMIALSHHRHELLLTSEECIVCQVLTKQN